MQNLVNICWSCDAFWNQRDKAKSNGLHIKDPVKLTYPSFTNEYTPVRGKNDIPAVCAVPVRPVAPPSISSRVSTVQAGDTLMVPLQSGLLSSCISVPGSGCLTAVSGSTDPEHPSVHSPTLPPLFPSLSSSLSHHRHCTRSSCQQSAAVWDTQTLTKQQ